LPEKAKSNTPITARQNALKYLLVGSTVILNIAGALVMDYAAEIEYPVLLDLFVITCIIIAFNAWRIMVWSFVHKRFELSKSYPIIAIAFPIMLLISVYQGESSFNTQNISGSLLIISGLLLLSKGENT